MASSDLPRAIGARRLSLVRILEVAPFAAPIDEQRTELGGAQIILQDLSRGLAARGHIVTLVAARGSHVDGVELLDLGIDSARMQRADLGLTTGERSDEPAEREAFAKVRAWVDANASEIDVIHAHAYDAPAFASLVGAPRPVAHTLHLPPLDEAEVNRITFLGIKPYLNAEPALASAKTLVVEVGGGSTEVLLVQNHQVAYSHTYRLGSLRLREMRHRPRPGQP